VADLLQDASAWLTDQLQAHASRPVTYSRDSVSAEVNATIGKTVFETTNEFGLVERWESRDFLIPAAALVLDGTATLPARGDVIRETQGATTFVYEVLAPGKEPHYRYSDTFRTLWRIHTKLVGTEAV